MQNTQVFDTSRKGVIDAFNVDPIFKDKVREFVVSNLEEVNSLKKSLDQCELCCEHFDITEDSPEKAFIYFYIGYVFVLSEKLNHVKGSLIKAIKMLM